MKKINVKQGLTTGLERACYVLRMRCILAQLPYGVCTPRESGSFVPWATTLLLVMAEGQEVALE